MSQSSGASEPIVVDRDGVTVNKRLLRDAFPVPTIELELTSNLDEPVDVVLREYVPDGYSLESIGFHSDYESEHWSAYQDKRIEFTRTIAPDETVRTIYGLRVAEDADTSVFMEEPELVSVTPASARTTHRPTASGTTEGGSGPSASARGRSTDTEPTTVTPDLDDLPAGAIAEALAAEFRDGAVDADDREAIQSALDLDLSNSAEAQFRHLQTRIEDLIAYTDMIEEFVDAGGPKERFEEIESSVEELSATVDELAEHKELAEEEHAALDERVSDLEDHVSEIATWRDQLGEMFVEKED